MMEARTVSRTMTDVSHLPAAVVEAYRRCREAEEAAPLDPGSRTHSQKCTIAQRTRVLWLAIDAAGIDQPETLCLLANQADIVQLSLF
jgi:hypothetical protein